MSFADDIAREIGALFLAAREGGPSDLSRPFTPNADDGLAPISRAILRDARVKHRGGLLDLIYDPNARTDRHYDHHGPHSERFWTGVAQVAGTIARLHDAGLEYAPAPSLRMGAPWYSPQRTPCYPVRDDDGTGWTWYGHGQGLLDGDWTYVHATRDDQAMLDWIAGFWVQSPTLRQLIEDAVASGLIWVEILDPNPWAERESVA